LIVFQDIAPGQEQTEDGNANPDRRGEADTEAVDYQSGRIEMTEKDSSGQSIMVPGMQSLGFGAGLGFDSTGSGGFPNMAGMGQGGDFNQMQMMMAMQNGMMPNAFGAFPMMGMLNRYASDQTNADNVLRNAGNDNGSYGNAEYVHERRFWYARHGHERHEHGYWDGRLRWRSWGWLQ
jgi:hypothetical protein